MTIVFLKKLVLVFLLGNGEKKNGMIPGFDHHEIKLTSASLISVSVG
jgi:sRNA-binding regulator protein Hfq